MTEGTFKFDIPAHHKSIIKVIGVGGGGSNAVNHMFNQGITGVEFVVCNTDSQALNTSPIPNKLQIGVNLTEGLGAGANPEKGKHAALENKEDIRTLLSEDTKMVFITAGMGGGTGTGAAPVIAQVAKELGILTVGIVTVPFKFEGKKKMQQAMAGVDSLKANCDTVLTILNDKLLEVFGNLSLNQAFGQADNVLTTAAKGIAEIITVPGYVNVDFEDVKTVMKDSGGAVMGSAETTGENRALRAAEEAINSPLLNNQNIQGCDKILLSIISGDQAELKMDELTEITDFMQEIAGEDAEVIFGHGVDSELGESIRVTIIATGFEVAKKLDVNHPEAKQDEHGRKIFDLEKDSQIGLFNSNPPKYKDETFEEDFKLKMKSFEFEKPERSEEESLELSNAELEREKEQEQFEFDMRELFEESQEPRLVQDAPLEELSGMAHQPSRKIQLMEQSDQRRKKLDGVSEDVPMESNDFKEKLEVPAYQRKKVNLKKSPMSQESLISRYNLNGDNELGNNKFLHDNVD
ncbi:MAG: cell division protein FtsZ [Reichenbachiella sp.]